jgi:glycosyltransferase involved in cell wall biosynthesis
MCPEYLSLAAPLARLRGMQTVLWYTHPSRGRALSLAERLADRITTALPGSYPGHGPKVDAIGHSIDMRRFAATDPPATAPRELLALGRTSPVKGYRDLIEAMAVARDGGADLRLTIVGPSTTDSEQQHRDELQRVVDGHDLGPVVRIEPGVSPKEVPILLERSSALVNLTAAGSADKVVFEAMAAYRPVIVRDAAFRDLVANAPIELTCRDDVASIADRLRVIAAAPAEVLAETGALLRQRVELAHSIDSWADAIVDLARS